MPLQPQEPTHLDTPGFTGILHLLLEYADDILLLRLLNRSARDGIDAKLWSHIVLNEATIQLPQGFISAAKYTFDGPPSADDDTAAQVLRLPLNDHVVARFLPFARIVDPSTASGLPTRHLVTSTNMPRLTTVRLMPEWDAGESQLDIFDAPEYIIYATCRHPCGIVDRSRAYPPSLKRLVINVLVDTSEGIWPEGVDLAPGYPDDMHCTVIFRDASSATPLGPDRWYWSAYRPPAMGTFRPLAKAMTEQGRRLAVTFVNFELLRPEWLGMQEDATVLGHEYLRLLVAAEAPRSEVAPSWAEGVEFLTVAEYISKVGRERFALETGV
ncbi:uncharacterized protein EHS24_001661 [Apiotrichum porosum]|uniref:Uncharacterized protein n=1 Tax=Apiotrichum porosum TaxID=105984 RepID=A0A427XIN9_9TREE|nr:uncharacterized protein EHS24_001661 [Apiotrichum porosum]RSH78755.1 hypothetical protein EHS24_001661 [Apiotrichum porosum]